MNKRAGICINPATPLTAIEHVLDVADQVMVMTDQPRLGRPEDAPGDARQGARALRSMLDARGLNPDIEVDGGVKANNAAACVAAGANVLVCGSSVYNSESSPQRKPGVSPLSPHAVAERPRLLRPSLTKRS